MLQQRQEVQLTQSLLGMSKFSDVKLQNGATSSDIVAKRRDMFQSANERTMQGVNPKEIVYQNGSKLIPRNVLLMTPLQSRSITYPQIFMPNQQLYISLKGNFYTIRDTRNKQKFIQRNSFPLSQIVYFNVEKKDQKLVMVSVEVFQGSQQIWYHVDLVLWDLDRDCVERRWAVEKGLRGGEVMKNVSGKQVRSLNALSQQQQQSQSRHQFQSTELKQKFKCIQLLDSYKKALLILDTTYITSTNSNNESFLNQHQLPHKYQILQINLTGISKSLQSLPTPSLLLHNPDTFPTKVTGYVVIQRLVHQSMVKLINSDYGDIVLLVTSQDIYQLQISSKGLEKQHYLITLKPLGVPKMLMQNKNTYISKSNIAHLKQSLSQQQLIIDARYFPNSLKVLILTTHGRVMVIESQQCIFTQSLYQLLSPKDILQSYNIQYFLFNSLHFLNELLIVSVQAQREEQCNLVKKVTYEQSILDKLDERKQSIDYVSRGVVVAKVQSNALSFNKFIPLPFDIKTHTYIKIHTSQQIDQMLIQTINLKTPSLLELYKCQVLSSRNTFMPFFTEHLLVENKIEQKSIRVKQGLTVVDDKSSESAKFTFGKGQKVFYMVKNHRVWCYRIYSHQFMMNEQSGIKKAFMTSFFQKPIKLLTNPLTGNVIILFREFIKIFNNIYQSLELLHTINIRQVRDIIFSRYGESMFLAMNDNTIYMLDSYTFQQRKVMDVAGEIKQILCPNEYLFCVKSGKDLLSLYGKNFQPRYDQKSDGWIFYDKLYEIRLQNGDVYCVDETLAVVLKRSGFVEIYSHLPETRPRGDSGDDNQQLRFQLLKNQHRHLVNRKPLGLEKSDQPSYLFYSSQFMTLFVGTLFGHIYQYLMPFVPIDDPSPPQCYHYQVSNSSIIHIQISGNFQSLVVGSQKGEIFELGFQQYLNGLRKNGVYVVSKSQNNIDDGMVKYQYANRSYLMDNLTTINSKVAYCINQSYQQCALIDEKLKIDFQDILARIKSQSTNQLQKLYLIKRQSQSQFKIQFNSISDGIKRQSKLIFQKLVQMRTHNQKVKLEMIEAYERELLGIYRESDRLQRVKGEKIQEFRKEMNEMMEELVRMREEQERMKQVELQRLEQSCRQLEGQYAQYSAVASQQLTENSTDLQLLKQQQIQRYSQKLQLEQSKKQSYLSQLTRTQKQIQRYKRRSIEFENLIVQTTNQIQQLSSDINIYTQKKFTLSKQLYEKSSMIQHKQAEIVEQIKKTTQLKKVKNVHEFELQQFQGQIKPISDKIQELDEKVQRMNNQIMVLFNSKVEQNKVIEQFGCRIRELKVRNKQLIEKALYSRTRMLRFTQSLADILSTNPFAADIRRRLSHVIDTFSDTSTAQITPNYDIQCQNKHSEQIIRKKNMLLKSIQREEKLQQGVIKNKNQYFRFYSDNTNLVKEYNQLVRENNVLDQEKTQLQKKLNILREQMQHKMTPVKRATSLQSIKKVSAIKLTPFQRYEQEQMQMTSLKLKGTTETRLTRGQTTSSFLKSLIKDVSVAESKYEKNTRVRDRIRTFINQEPQRQKQIHKQLFLRQKGKSSHMPILKL